MPVGTDGKVSITPTVPPMSSSIWQADSPMGRRRGASRDSSCRQPPTRGARHSGRRQGRAKRHGDGPGSQRRRCPGRCVRLRHSDERDGDRVHRAGIRHRVSDGAALPLASNLNLERTGQTIANHVTIGVGDGASDTLFTDGGTHLLADVNGYYLQSLIPLQ